MSRFTSYLSSAITPQMTLLEKFNALLKYLEKEDNVELFPSVFCETTIRCYTSVTALMKGFEPTEEFTYNFKSVPVAIADEDHGYSAITEKSAQLLMETFGFPSSANTYNEILAIYWSGADRGLVLMKSPNKKAYFVYTGF